MISKMVRSLAILDLGNVTCCPGSRCKDQSCQGPGRDAVGRAWKSAFNRALMVVINGEAVRSPSIGKAYPQALLFMNAMSCGDHEFVAESTLEALERVW